VSISRIALNEMVPFGPLRVPRPSTASVKPGTDVPSKSLVPRKTVQGLRNSEYLLLQEPRKKLSGG
jgi:hypothetical protein